MTGRRILTLVLAVLLTLGAAWASDNVGFGRKMMTLFAQQPQTAMGSQLQEGGGGQFSPEGDGTGLQNRGSSGTGPAHGAVNPLMSLLNLGSYAVILVWIIMAVNYLEKLLRRVSKRRKHRDVILSAT